MNKDPSKVFPQVIWAGRRCCLACTCRGAGDYLSICKNCWSNMFIIYKLISLFISLSHYVLSLFLSVSLPPIYVIHRLPLPLCLISLPPLTLPFPYASKSSAAPSWRSSWWTWWCTPWSAPRRRNTLMPTSEGPASCCGSTSPPSSSSLSCFSLQAFHTWCCHYIKR